MKAKILFIDIETSPIIGYSWGMYEQNIIKRLKATSILSVAYKWFDQKTKVIACDNQSEKSLLLQLRLLLNEADIVVAHNGDSFDIKKINSRFIVHRIPPPDPYKTIDTRTEAKRIAAFDSSSLENLGIDLGEGEKIKHRGFTMWEGCMAGKSRDWSDMKKYNKKDVDLLYRVYMRLRGWMKRHPNVTLYELHPDLACPVCKSVRINKRGYDYRVATVVQRYVCRDCFKTFYAGSPIKKAVAK